MRSFKIAAVAATVFASTGLAQMDPIVIKGSKFFYKTNGTEFFIKGVAYQQDISSNGTTSGNNNYKDPLTDATACARDIPLLQELQTNTIRVYAIDPTKDHSQCMQMLENAGIYVVADLSAPGASIIRDDPQWNDDLYKRYTAVVDVMANYTNTLGFFAGNEVSNNKTNTDASAFVKAAVRDMKAYIKAQGYRAIGVGYATNDDADIRTNLAKYFNCGDSADSIEFWGYNIYSWCGQSSFTESGYDVRTKEFSSYNVPVFFAEYGCIKPSPRQFGDVPTLFGDQMTPVWSGGIVYMYFQEVNNYGLVSIDSSGQASKMPDFSVLSSQIAGVTPTGPNMKDYNPTNTAAASCPSVGSDWQAASALPPTPNEQLCGCMSKSLSCVPSKQITDKNAGGLFDLVCGLDPEACLGIRANGKTGNYGAYGMCNANEQLGWVLNQYYSNQTRSGNGASACDFSGSASLQSAASPTGQCVSLISQAGNGQGTVTTQPTGTAKASGSGAKSSKGSVGQVSAPSMNVGRWQLGVYVVVAIMSGVGMILL